ncbi:MULTISPECIES: uracil-DNA glycosylase [Oceanobacillus]|uniref:Uracil-DNA glycosylase n=1 Tax=Oceanobacillus indicireducens TaxID=1004261 RepID=A0A917XXM7_9BACI|nr:MULTISPECIES: uracil-DNA glycosylase [Oceanobacillus]GGN55987.1 uracil-DNA glycosylase [Oceanobacillus indicireducens]
MTILKNDWAPLLEGEFQKKYYLELREFLKEEYKNYKIHPDMDDIFNALHYTSYENTRVVLIGQDPYHGPNQAHGLSFSVQKGVAIPPSLRNIYKELQSDLGIEPPAHGYLKKWADEGVLLLNTVLTVREKQPASHRGKGWEHFTNKVIQLVNEKTDPVVFILWGKHAQEKEIFLTNKRHHIIKSPHPSPFSANRGFFGSRPFSETNEFLSANGRAAVDWEIR